MMRKQSYKLYDQVINISEDYLGPATKRFIDRQIAAHIGKEPSALTSKDLIKLTDWIEASVSLLTKDSVMIAEYTRRLKKLAESKKK